MPLVPAPSLDSTAKMTDLAYGECIPLSREISVCYNNATQFSATLSLSCSCGATVTPSSISILAWQNGCATFTVTHAMAGNGHTITANLIQISSVGTPVLLSSDEVGVNVGDPCPVASDQNEGIVGGIARLARNADQLTGKYNPAVGNFVILLLEDPAKIVDGIVKRSRLIFADPAKVNPEQGTWKHNKIPNAEKGHHLRIVLTKDGVVKSIVRAIYDK
jgi:hypothetical protein